MFRCRLVLPILLFGLSVSIATAQPIKGKVKNKEPEKKVQGPAELDSYFEDLKVVRQGGLKGEGPDILEYFRKRTLKQPDPKQIAALVKDLGDEDFPTREKAFQVLAEMGTSALAGLKEGENDPSVEVRKRIAELKLRIDTKAEPTLQAAAARVLAKLKPEGTADGLMSFLPFASDPMVIDEI
ncbi:MAG TPA: hypothetical protein VFE62_19335, partial [Gemmataceae bacterium]|nr:hypothetical protein [Gemmataceae bacterium]